MVWQNVFFALLAWVGIVFLELVLLAIAHFFEKNSGQRTFYRFYLLPILFTLYGAGRYIWRMVRGSPYPDFIGDPVANVCLLIAGLSLLLLGETLHNKMMKGSNP
ncbi:MAG: hypothetical protein ACLFU8_05170 [Anaerolineales bacterium]